MSAKELKDSKYFQHKVDGEVVNEGYLFSLEEMNLFWSLLCKEQRDLCVEYGFVHNFLPNEPKEEKVRCSPEPEFS